jgi:hypothetical protein
LKFGPSNNFVNFKETISKKALGHFGASGKQIEEPKQLEHQDYKLEDKMDKAIYLEDLKSYHEENQSCMDLF